LPRDPDGFRPLSPAPKAITGKGCRQRCEPPLCRPGSASAKGPPLAKTCRKQDLCTSDHSLTAEPLEKMQHLAQEALEESSEGELYCLSLDISNIDFAGFKATPMITGLQIRAARALLRIDQKTLARMAGLSVPTIQRMEANDSVVGGVVDSLTRVVAAIESAGVDLIADGATSSGGGRGARLRHSEVDRPDDLSAEAARGSE